MGLWVRLSYSGRLFLGLVVYSVLLVGCVLFFQYGREKDFKAEELNARLQVINGQILQSLGNDSFNIEDVVHDGFQELRVSVIGSDGRIVYDNSVDRLPEINHLNRQEIAQAVRLGTGFTVRRHSESTGETYFYSAKRGGDGVIVRTAVPYSVSLNELLKADRKFLWFLAVLTVVMCLFGYFATRRVGLHIRRLRRFAENAENGDRIYDTEPFPHDELGDISNHIVRLYASLQQAVAERDREHAAALHEQQEKERIKKRLTNNINHELKTPVASIRICLETLMAHPDMAKEKRLDFLSRCFANSGRLQQLLSDVSTITRMEDGPQSIDREEIDLAEIIECVVGERIQDAENKGIAICDYVDAPIPLHGNRSLWESVFFNLIENAMAYSGGDRIVVRSQINPEGKTVITVTDNGIGVPDEHLPRLFERFYRVDKGRSRAVGGTGLGLSIVKNAVQLHGGSISVVNRKEGGLEFTINLTKP